VKAWASEGGVLAPLGFENFSQKGCFFISRRKKTNFTTFGPPGKYWKTPLAPPPGKNPSDTMCESNMYLNLTPSAIVF